jgi:hypothetical protein
MNETPDEPDLVGRKLLNKAKTDSLRKRMRDFVGEQKELDFKQLREAVSEGDDLSTIVRENRDERS